MQPAACQLNAGWAKGILSVGETKSHAPLGAATCKVRLARTRPLIRQKINRAAALWPCRVPQPGYSPLSNTVPQVDTHQGLRKSALDRRSDHPEICPTNRKYLQSCARRKIDHERRDLPLRTGGSRSRTVCPDLVSVCKIRTSAVVYPAQSAGNDRHARGRRLPLAQQHV